MLVMVTMSILQQIVPEGKPLRVQPLRLLLTLRVALLLLTDS